MPFSKFANISHHTLSCHKQPIQAAIQTNSAWALTASGRAHPALVPREGRAAALWARRPCRCQSCRAQANHEFTTWNRHLWQPLLLFTLETPCEQQVPVLPFGACGISKTAPPKCPKGRGQLSQHGTSPQSLILNILVQFEFALMSHFRFYLQSG